MYDRHHDSMRQQLACTANVNVEVRPDRTGECLMTITDDCTLTRLARIQPLWSRLAVRNKLAFGIRIISSNKSHEGPFSSTR